MTKFARLAALAVAVTCVASPAFAQTAVATPKARASANIIKPLTLQAQQNLDFGTIVVTGSDTVSVSQAGVRTCGAVANMTCSGTAQAAVYHVTGANNQLVTVNQSNSTLTNTTGPSGSLTFVPNAPGSITLPNSGAAGINFNVGGSIGILSSTPEGVYVGDIEVTVQY